MQSRLNRSYNGRAATGGSVGVLDKEELLRIEYLVIDVDGTMTDAGIYYDDLGNEWKKFCTKDAAGFFAARQVGIKIMVLTGRECNAVARRMKEMKVDFLVQNIKNKESYLEQFMSENNLSDTQVGYLGDDLNDVGAMRLSTFVGCPADACEEVKKRADYISGVKGGAGAVRDIIEWLLKQRGQWEEAIAGVYGSGI